MNFRIALVSVFLIEISIIGLSLYLYKDTTTATQNITLLSGRLSLVIFSLIFIFNRKAGNFDKLLFGKPYLLLAVAHGIHFIEIVVYHYFSDQVLIPIRLLGGSIAYLFIFLMPYISFRYENGKLYQNHFRIIENIYHFYIWFSFFMVYLSRVRGTIPNPGGDLQNHIILLGWLSLIMGMKLMGILMPKLPRSR